MRLAPVFNLLLWSSFMKTCSKMICQLLITVMIAFPFSVHAGMVPTDQSISSVDAVATRDAVRDFVSRDTVAVQLESLGVSRDAAQQRVDSMTQDEVNRLAGEINTLPAGGMAHGWWWAIAAVVVAGVIYTMYYRPNSAR
jgi:hypothetical protein